MNYEVYIFRFEEITSILVFDEISKALELNDLYNSEEYQKMGYGATWKCSPKKGVKNATL